MEDRLGPSPQEESSLRQDHLKCLGGILQKPTLPGFGVPTLPSFGSSNLPGLPIQTHDPLDYSTSRGGGLPSLLSFSSNSNSPSHMRSPPRRLLPEPELEISRHDDPLNSQPWRWMDS